MPARLWVSKLSSHAYGQDEAAPGRAAAPDSDVGEEEEDGRGSSDDERHRRLLQAVTSKQPGSRRRLQQQVMTEAYPESEANLPPMQSASGLSQSLWLVALLCI